MEENQKMKSGTQKLKKFLAFVMTAVMVFTAVPFGGLTFSASAEDEGYYTYTVENGEATITDCDESISGEVVIPDTLGGYPVTSIGYEAFRNCTGLTSITIPDSVTSIGEDVFRGCTGLTSITIPDSVTSIGWGAFEDCTSLTSITIPYSVTSIGYWAFSHCTGLTSVTIPDSVTSIGDYAFFDCTGLTSITIPDSVTSIGGMAFYGCASLTSITIPDSVTSIGDGAFIGCTGLTSITVSTGNTVYHSTDNCLIETESKTLISGCKNSIIPSDGSVTSIDNGALDFCSGLTSITIPDSVTSIGDGAFIGCTGLTSITVSTGNTVYHSTDNCLIETESKTLILGCKNSVIPSDGSVTSIGFYAFSGCTGLTSVTIPDSVTSIVSFAFIGCTGLTSITIPESVTSIGDCSFYGCTGLTSVTIQDGVTSIGDMAFYNCTGLTSITIPDAVTSIGEEAFANCTDLTSITIPDSVTDIGNKAFGYYEDESTYEEKKVENFTIYGRPGTAAETYANENGFAFIALDEEHTHTYSAWVVITEPTCTADGEETRTCSVCGATETRPVEKKAHDLFRVEEASTCKVQGVSYDVCDSCGNTFNYTVLPLAPHTFGEWAVTTEPTCTAEGEETRTCSVCGATENRPVEKKAHDLFRVEEASTCKVQGVSYDVCDSCGNTFNYTVLPLAPHTFGEWAVTTESTCTAEGEETRTCSVCGVTETRPVEKKAHTFGDWVTTKEATVFESGERKRTCTACGFEETEEIEKLEAKETKDENTGISVVYPESSYEGEVEISVTQTFDGASYHVLNAEKGNYQKALFDITTVIDGEKVQPNGSVFVKIPLPDGYNAEKTVVYYITNDGRLEKMDSRVEDGYIVFETTHFSFYAIVDETEKQPENPSANCSCACHKKGIAKLFFKIKLFFQKIFKKNRVCKCGVNHY